MSKSIDPRAVLEAPVRRYYRIAPDVALDELPEPVRTWVSYSLGSVDRGRLAIGEVAAHKSLAGARVLDAGCAYGGYLAAACEAGAAEVVGIELDPRLAVIAEELVAAYGLPAKVVTGSAVDVRLLADLVAGSKVQDGRGAGFDVITCADVIEHVEDPLAALTALVGALAPGGVLYLAIPNFRHPAWVESDPHFQFFGITLLDPPAAREYATSVRQEPSYDVGEYHTLAWYRGALDRAGADVWLLNPPGGSRDLSGELRRDVERLTKFATGFSNPKLSPRITKEVQVAVREWGGTLCRGLDLLAEQSRPAWWHRWWPGRRGPSGEIFDEHAVQTWRLIAARRG